MKKFLCLLLSVVLTATAFTALPVTAWAAESGASVGDSDSGNVGGCEWSFDTMTQVLTISQLTIPL